MFLHTLACLGSSAGVFLVYAMLIIIQIHPWYQPQYFIPVLGMLLGNAISGISVGLSTLLEELSSGVRFKEGMHGNYSSLVASWAKWMMTYHFAQRGAVCLTRDSKSCPSIVSPKSNQAKPTRLLQLVCMHGVCVGPRPLKGEAWVASHAFEQLEMTIRSAMLHHFNMQFQLR